MSLEAKHPFSDFIDLAAERLGGKVLYANDEFFAEKENLIKPGRGIFIPGKYTDRGKWMDGWESRRRRIPGNDWCVVKLAVPGRIFGLDIDTNHFLGNHPAFGSVEGLNLENDPPMAQLRKDNLNWEPILEKSPLDPGSRNLFEVESEKIWTHLKLSIFPDGGVARFKVFGKVERDLTASGPQEMIDLAAAVNGGKALLCNDMFFSSMDNLIYPGRGKNMGDGWETKRNRNQNNVDWVVIKLGAVGIIKKIVVDTAHFKGNFPDSCSLEGCLADQKMEDPTDCEWFGILSKVKLEADREHFFEKELLVQKPCSHVRLNIYPDGGISRLRLWGHLEKGKQKI